MTEDYVERRRAYVSEVRNSFEEENTGSASEDGKRRPAETSAFFIKIRLIVSGLILGLFLAFQFSGIDIMGYTSEDVIAEISDNHYYTKLMEYVKIDVTEPKSSLFGDTTETSEEIQ